MYLKKKGINCTVHYIPTNKHIFYKKKFKKFNLKNSDYIFDNIISIPFHNNLKEKDIILFQAKLGNFFKTLIMKRSNTYIIAEIGINHNGSIQIAKRLILDAKGYASAAKISSF